MEKKEEDRRMLVGLSPQGPPERTRVKAEYTYQIHPGQEIRRGCWMAFGASLFLLAAIFVTAVISILMGVSFWAWLLSFLSSL